MHPCSLCASVAVANKYEVVGTCNLVTADGTSLSKGADLIVNNGYTYYLAVSALSSGSSAVVCYRDGSNSYKGATTAC